MMTELEINLIILCSCIIVTSIVVGTIVETVLDYRFKERRSAIYYHKWFNLNRAITAIVYNDKNLPSEKISQLKGFLNYGN